MNAFPFQQELGTAISHLDQQATQIGPLDSNAVDQLGQALRSQKVDLGLSRSGDMNMGWFVIERVDDDTEAERAMNDDQLAL